MSQQTTYGLQARGYPGERVGMGPHQSDTYVNDLGEIKQIDDVVITLANTHQYLFTVNGIAVTFLSGAAATAAQVRDGLIAAFRAILDLENVATIQPNGNNVRITAKAAGTGMTVATTDGSLAVTHTTANVAKQSIPFGVAVVKRTGTGTNDQSAALPSAPVAQVTDITGIGAVNTTNYGITVNIPDQGDFVVEYLSDGTATIAEIRDGLIARINALALSTFISAAASGNNVRLTSLRPGIPFTVTEVDANLGVTAVTANSDPLFLGIAERIHSNVDPTAASNAIAPGSAMSIGRRGKWYVTVEGSVAVGDRAYYRTAAGAGGANIGEWRNDGDSNTADLAPSCVFRTSTTGRGIAVLDMNLP